MKLRIVLPKIAFLTADDADKNPDFIRVIRGYLVTRLPLNPK
jgi:hypothetical protein